MADLSLHTEALRAAYHHLTTQVAALTGDAFDDNFADSGQVAAEQGENRLLAGELQTELADVERALAKLDDGSYGTCEVCGERIAAARLDAMPATRYCIDHA